MPKLLGKRSVKPLEVVFHIGERHIVELRRFIVDENAEEVDELNLKKQKQELDKYFKGDSDPDADLKSEVLRRSLERQKRELDKYFDNENKQAESTSRREESAPSSPDSASNKSSSSSSKKNKKKTAQKDAASSSNNKSPVESTTLITTLTTPGSKASQYAAKGEEWIIGEGWVR